MRERLRIALRDPKSLDGHADHERHMLVVHGIEIDAEAC